MFGEQKSGRRRLNTVSRRPAPALWLGGSPSRSEADMILAFNAIRGEAAPAGADQPAAFPPDTDGPADVGQDRRIVRFGILPFHLPVDK